MRSPLGTDLDLSALDDLPPGHHNDDWILVFLAVFVWLVFALSPLFTTLTGVAI